MSEGESTLPPGPRAPALLQTYMFARRIVPFVSRARRRYGDVFTLRLMGWGNVVVVADPDLVQEIVTGPAEVFQAGEANPRMEQLLGPNSLMALDGSRHLSARQRIKPALHGEAVRGYEAVVSQLMLEHLREWPVGEVVYMYRESREIMSEVILRTVLGAQSSPHLLEELRQLVEKVVDVTMLISPSFLYRQLEALPPWKGYWAAVARMRALVDEIVDERERGGGSGASTDMLSMLIDAGGDDHRWIRDQLMTLILAGQETMPASFSWAVELLARHPHARTMARERSDPYLEAVVVETLRLTAVPGAARMLTAPALVGPYSLPAGVMLMPLAYLISHDPRLYEEPEEFRPERWQDERPGTYTWLPFGGGPRRCIGAAFAQMILKRSLGTMLEHMDWRGVGGKPEGYKTAHVSLIPAAGAPIERTR